LPTRFLHLTSNRLPSAGSPSPGGEIFDAFLDYCESRMHDDDLIVITVATFDTLLTTSGDRRLMLESLVAAIYQPREEARGTRHVQR